jgi:hypothetical protein
LKTFCLAAKTWVLRTSQMGRFAFILWNGVLAKQPVRWRRSVYNIA